MTNLIPRNQKYSVHMIGDDNDVYKYQIKIISVVPTGIYASYRTRVGNSKRYEKEWVLSGFFPFNKLLKLQVVK